MKQLTVMDAFCGGGGIGEGFSRAGFRVLGVDLRDMSRVYRHTFMQMDAIDAIKKFGSKFDLIIAGPPCQFDGMMTAGTNAGKFEYPDLLVPTRQALLSTGRPFIIEQPPGRATARMNVSLQLCGLMFNLKTFRDRNFEIHGFDVSHIRHPSHVGHLTAGWRHGCLRTFEESVCPKHHRWCRATVFGVYGKGGGKPSVAEAQRALGIDWMHEIYDLNQAIPPAYGEYIAKEYLRYIGR